MQQRPVNRQFLIILIAEAISAIGTQVTKVAVPLTAVLVLHADAFDMGILNGASTLPAALFGLIAGTLIDRMSKRRVLIIANAACAVVMLLVPVGYALVFLSLPLLMLVRFVARAISVGESVGLTTMIPELVPSERLAVANGRFGATMSVTTVIGPAVAGVLIAAFGAPGAITVDAASFAIAVVLIALLPNLPPPSINPSHRSSLRSRLREGWDYLRNDPVMRPLMRVVIALNFFASVFGALEPLFIVGHLGVKPAWFGGGIAAGGLGAIGGAMISSRIASRFSLMTTLSGTMVLFVIALAGISALHGPPLIVAIEYGAFSLIAGFGGAMINVSIMTHIQSATPPAVMARVMGGLISFVRIASPAGGLIGGIVAAEIGLRPALEIATAGIFTVLVITIAARRMQ